MANILVEATKQWVEPKYPRIIAGRYLTTHELQWRYNVGPWLDKTEEEALHLLAGLSFGEFEAIAVLSAARGWGNITVTTEVGSPNGTR